MTNRVRDLRLEQGLSQHELADLAGVSRQLIGAIEVGRNVPGVDAALRIAGALRSSVEAVFAPSEEAAPAARPISAALPSGTGVVVGRVGAQRVYAPVRHLLTSAESWALTDGFIENQSVHMFDDAVDDGFIVAGCDPLLGLAATLLTQRRGPRVVPVHLATANAVSALADGLVHGVLVHGRAGTLPTPPVPVRRWIVSSWRVGIASAKRRELTSVDELVERKLRTAQREEGAGTQRALERALKRVGALRVPGPRVDGHIDAARHVAAGVAAGITMEAAATAFGLGFLPLETHVSELWINAAHVDERGAIALIGLLTEPALRMRAQRLPGYETHRMGTEVLAS